MFKRMLLVQWKWSRWSVLLLSLFAIAVTMWSVSVSEIETPGLGLSSLGSRLEGANWWYHVLAWAGGFLLGMHAWRTDHAGRHVYALSLPIPRWRLVLYRYSGGLLMAGIIVVTLWLSASLASSIVDVPPGLNTYPTGLALRFGIALLATYALFFAIWSATRRTGYYMAALLVAFILLNSIQISAITSILERGLTALWRGVGFTEIMSGRWFLIDV